MCVSADKIPSNLLVDANVFVLGVWVIKVTYGVTNMKLRPFFAS